jgi:hypothetical protein
MLIIKRSSTGAYATNEAAVSFNDVRHETFKTEKQDFSIVIFNRTVVSCDNHFAFSSAVLETQAAL